MNVISDTENISSHAPPIFDGQPAIGAPKQAWHKEDAESNNDDERQLLEEYSGLKPEEAMPHVIALVSSLFLFLFLEIFPSILLYLYKASSKIILILLRLLILHSTERDVAFSIWSYACIGQTRFLANNLSRLPFHEKVLARLRLGATFCDAGCCFGQQFRFLAHQGIPSTQLCGFDLESDFIEFGYQLFRDRDRFRATFVSANVLASPTSSEGVGLTELESKMDVVRVFLFARLRLGSDDCCGQTPRVAHTAAARVDGVGETNGQRDCGSVSNAYGFGI